MTGMGRSGAGVLQKRRIGSRGFTREKRARFLDALAASCNVTAAARYAGVDDSTARRLRRNDGGFAQLWAEAIDLGQERLKEELIARALGQVPDEANPDGERAAVPSRVFDPELALRVLQIQARTSPAGRGGRPVAGPGPTREQIAAALAERLEQSAMRIARRAEAGDRGNEPDGTAAAASEGR